MSLLALRHFVVVAEELHMHRAAERLHIAQPALSQQIKQLEQRLGVVLFSRANRRLTLTAAGEAFLHKTRLALEMADQARETGTSLEACEDQLVDRDCCQTGQTDCQGVVVEERDAEQRHGKEYEIERYARDHDRFAGPRGKS